MGWTEQDIINHQLRLAEGLASSVHQKPKRNKYGVSPKEERTVEGIVFASKAEARGYTTLLALQRAGKAHNLELQPRFILQEKFTDSTGEKHRAIYYVADFAVDLEEGGTFKPTVIDVKGSKTPVYLLKKKLFRFKYPNVDFREWK